jgi:hypothetical protein
MFDVKIPVASKTDYYSAHYKVVRALEQLGLARQPHLFCLDPLNPGTLLLRSEHQAVSELGQVVDWPVIRKGAQYHFCMRVSPITSIGKRKVWTTDHNTWARTHLQNAGSEVVELHTKASVARIDKGTGFTLPDVVAIGRIAVQDPTALLVAMKTGIGRHRAFGFGLLQVLPIQGV